MTYTYLKHSNVSAGSAVDLAGRVAIFDFNNFIQSPEVPSKDVGSDYNFRLAEVDYTGHTNPKWVLEGYIPSGVQNADANNNSRNDAGSMLITFKLLGSFCMLGSPVTFFDNDFILHPAGSTWVLPETFKIEKDVSKSGRKFNLVVRETKQW